MIVYELNSRAESNSDDLKDLTLMVYIIIAVFGGTLLILIGCIVSLFIWVHKLSNRHKTKQPLSTESMGRTLNPSEELAKRYIMTGYDNDGYDPNPIMEKNPLNRSTNFKHNYINNVHEERKRPDRRNEPYPRMSSVGAHFTEDRLRNDLYY